MKLGALGDVHGDFASVRAIMARHADVPVWVSVGDLGSAEGSYEAPPTPLYWIKGNNDNLEYISRLSHGATHVDNLHYVPNGIPVRIGGVRAVGLGGTFAPTWYDTLPGDLPKPRIQEVEGRAFPPLARDDKRRHFVRAEVEACKRLVNIDLFLSHESARPFPLDVRGRTQDVGKTPINEVLATLRPKMHLSGHHHVYSDDVRQGIRSIGLDPVGVSYLVIDLETWKYERLET
jgi:Icc-related predicted phosphoesterase